MKIKVYTVVYASYLGSEYDLSVESHTFTDMKETYDCFDGLVEGVREELENEDAEIIESEHDKCIVDCDAFGGYNVKIELLTKEFEV